MTAMPASERARYRRMPGEVARSSTSAERCIPCERSYHGRKTGQSSRHSHRSRDRASSPAPFAEGARAGRRSDGARRRSTGRLLQECKPRRGVELGVARRSIFAAMLSASALRAEFANPLCNRSSGTRAPTSRSAFTRLCSTAPSTHSARATCSRPASALSWTRDELR